MREQKHSSEIIQNIKCPKNVLLLIGLTFLGHFYIIAYIIILSIPSKFIDVIAFSIFLLTLIRLLYNTLNSNDLTSLIKYLNVGFFLLSVLIPKSFA